MLPSYDFLMLCPGDISEHVFGKKSRAQSWELVQVGSSTSLHDVHGSYGSSGEFHLIVLLLMKNIWDFTWVWKGKTNLRITNLNF